MPDSGWGADGTAADLGMRPAPNGLAFANTADPERTFDAADLIAMFGADGVCETATGPCVIRPEAQQWANTVAGAMVGGVCEGMAVLSLDRYIAGATPASTDLERSTTVERTIRRLFATQFLPQVISAAEASRTRNLGEVASDLEDRLGSQAVPVTIGLYANGLGHAVTPYAVERLDDGRAIVWVYDPNWPTADRFIEFDLENDRWRFPYANSDPTAAPGADNPDAVWFGNGSDLDVVALDTREAPFVEPFLGAGGGRPQLAVTTSGRAWSMTKERTGATIASPQSTPGDDNVRAVVRGGFGQTTMLADVADDEPFTFSTTSPGRLAVTSGERSLAVTFSGAGAATVETDSDQVLVRDVTGDVSVTLAAPGGVVSLDAQSESRIALTRTPTGASEVRWSTGGDTSATVTLSGSRRDFVVSADGAISEVATPEWPESVRTQRPLLESTPVAPATTSTTTQPSESTVPSPPTSRAPLPRPTTSQPPGTTEAPPPPSTSSTSPPTSTTTSSVTSTTKVTTPTTKPINGGR